MNIGLYQGAAAMTGLEQWQESIAQNLANASVSGYKKTEVGFEGRFEGSRPDRTHSDFAQTLPGWMPDAHGRTNFAAGNLIETKEPTHFALQGTGFFSVRDAQGNEFLTRNGQFRLDADNRLVTGRGEQVMGVDGPILIPLGPGKLHASPEGILYKGEDRVAQLAVTDVRAPEATLRKAPGGFLLPPGNERFATRAENPRIQQGAYENSNVSALREMVRMIEVQRAYEANARAVQAVDDNLAAANQALNTTG